MPIHDLETKLLQIVFFSAFDFFFQTFIYTCMYVLEKQLY